MLLESTFLNGIQKSTFQDALGTHVCCISAPSFTLARIIFSSFIFKKRGNVCSGKNNILDKNASMVYPGGDVLRYSFLLLELFISKTALGTFWENAQNLCFLFVVFLTAGKICFKYAFRLLIHFN